MDWGQNLNSMDVKNWLDKWGIKYRLSSAFYPQGNDQAEATVKSLKRIMEGNTEKNGKYLVKFSEWQPTELE